MHSDSKCRSWLSEVALYFPDFRNSVIHLQIKLAADWSVTVRHWCSSWDDFANHTVWLLRLQDHKMYLKVCAEFQVYVLSTGTVDDGCLFVTSVPSESRSLEFPVIDTWGRLWRQLLKNAIADVTTMLIFEIFIRLHEVSWRFRNLHKSSKSFIRLHEVLKFYEDFWSWKLCLVKFWNLKNFFEVLWSRVKSS